MNKADEKKILKALFRVSVDGQNCNAYAPIVGFMDDLPVEAKRLNFSLETLKAVLYELAKEWDKKIDKEMGL